MIPSCKLPARDGRSGRFFHVDIYFLALFLKALGHPRHSGRPFSVAACLLIKALWQPNASPPTLHITVCLQVCSQVLTWKQNESRGAKSFFVLFHFLAFICIRTHNSLNQYWYGPAARSAHLIGRVNIATVIRAKWKGQPSPVMWGEPNCVVQNGH